MVAELLLSGGLCAGMLISSYAIYRLRKHRAPLDTEESYGVILAAVLALLGLLLGFTMQSAMNGLVLEWQLTLSELNAVGTAYLRVDLLPEQDQPKIRELFRSYLAYRLHVADIVASGSNPEQAMREALQSEQQIWNKATTSKFSGRNAPARLFLVALNEMIDATEAHAFAQQRRLPTLVLALLFGSALISACFIGHLRGMHQSHGTSSLVVFAVIISATMYTILDLDNPRSGFIRTREAAALLRELHDSIPSQADAPSSVASP